MNKPLLAPSQTPVSARSLVRLGRKRVANDEATSLSSAAELAPPASDSQAGAPAQQDIALDGEALVGDAKVDDSSSPEVSADGAHYPATQAQGASAVSGTTSIVASVGVLAGVAAALSMGAGRSGSTAPAVPQAPQQGDGLHDPVAQPALQPEAATPAAPTTPAVPVAPVEPVTPAAPIAPVAPVAPVDPVTPVEPIVEVSESEQAVADEADSVDTTPPQPGIWVFSIDGGKTWTPGSISSVDASTLAEGLNIVLLAQRDSEGTLGPVTTVEITKDTTAPQAPQLEVIGAQAGLTPVIHGEGRIHVSGLEPGARWQFSVDGGQTWVPGEGTDIDAGDLVEGLNTVLAVQVDDAGHLSPVGAFEVRKDTVAPAAPQLAVAGSVGGDNATPMIDGSGSIHVRLVEDGATWLFSLDGGTTWVPGHGDRITASELNEGENTVLVMQIDEAGNRGPACSITVLKDAVAPAAPIVVEAQSGTVLINGTESVTVQTEAGAQWHYSLDGGLTWLLGTGHRIAAATLKEGLNIVQITQTDAAGNTSAPTLVEVTKDSMAPLPPDLGSGSLLLNGNGVVNIATESGASWSFSIDGGSTWTAGTGTSLAARQLREGLNRVQIVQTDAAGNVSEAASLTVLKDSVAPVAPVLPNGPIAINAQGSVQVTAAPDAAWSFSLDGGQTWTQGTGSSISAAQLREGNNSIAVVQSDAAGNLSEAAHIEVRKDTMVEIPLFYVSQYSQASGLQSYIWLANIEEGGKFQFQRTAQGPWEDGIGNTFNLENTVNNDHLEIIRFRQVDAVGNISEVYNFGYYY